VAAASSVRPASRHSQTGDRAKAPLGRGGETLRPQHREQPSRWSKSSATMHIVRDYFGLDRTTVTYDSEITGVGGDASAFYVVAEVTKSDGSLATRTVVTFSHDEVARMLADYRHNQPIEHRATPPLITGPSLGLFLRIRRYFARIFAVRIFAKIFTRSRGC
jgi:hypothetical protein